MDFAFRFDLFSRILMTPMGLGQRRSGVTVTGDNVMVRMGWGFRSQFPRAAVAGVQRLVNGAGRPLLELTLEPTQQARVCGVPVKLRRLLLSVEDLDGLIEALRVQ